MTEEEQTEQSTDENGEFYQRMIGYPNAQPEIKHNVHTFLHDVAVSKDTTKTGFLKDEELGLADHPVRAFKDLELFARDIMDNEELANYFKQCSENITSTSLSRDAKLLNLAVVTKREMADVTPIPKKENKGWFKKKNDNQQQS